MSCSAETAPSGSGQHLLPTGRRRGRRRRPVHHARHRGFDTDTAVGGLTAFSLLQVGGLLALPILALPAIPAGAPASPGLIHTALLGIAGFVLFAAFGVIVIRTERPLAALGRAAQRLWNWVTRGRRRPLTGLDKRLLSERDTIRAVLDRRWWQAVLLTADRPPSTPAAY